MTLQIKHLYSETAGNRPSADQVDVGQLWINAGDSTLGTKKNDGTVVTYAQLTEAEREAVRNAMPKTGQVAGVTISQIAGATDTDAATIDDNSDTVLEGTLTSNEFHVTVNKTTAHKNTKLVLKKPAGVTSTVTWTGVDMWLVGEKAPQFGDTQEEQELAVAIFTSPSKVAVNVIYNTEHPVEIEGGGTATWGEIEGTLSEQTDLQAVLNGKANASDLANYLPLAGGNVTGSLTYNSKQVATVDQIPDVSNFVTNSTLASYPTSEMVEAEFSSYDKNIKAHIEAELGGYLPLTGGTVSGALNVPTPTADTHAATKQYVDSAVASVYKYKGSVANQSALPSSNQTVGDVYNVEDTGDNFAWDGTKWDKLAGTVDLSAYVTKTVADSTYLGKTATATAATKLATARTISVSGDATGSASFDGSADATIALTLANSGVTADSYGPTAGTTLAFGGTVNVPQVTVDAKGRVTKAAHYAIKLPNAPTSVSGNAGTATKLATPHNLTTNLGSTAAGSFDGSEDVSIGVTGTLGTANGGTGRTDGKAVNVTQVVTLSAAGPLGYTSSNSQYLTTSAAIAYWNGRYSDTASNLEYCKTGTIVGSNGGTITGNLTVNGTLSGGTLNATSDIRLKNVLGEVENVDLSQLKPYRYTFKSDEKKEVHVGLIAQDVQKTVPEAVKVIDEDGHLGIEYNALVAILIDKVNELEKKVAQLEASVENTNTF